MRRSRILSLFLFIVSLPAFADMVTLSAIRDNSLFEEQAGTNHLSNGAGDFIFAGQTNIDTTRRALVQFDVAGSVPAGATITSAALRLNVTRRRTISPHTYTIHTLTNDWGEAGSDAPGQEGAGTPAQPGDTTWQHAVFGTEDWANAGGDFVNFASSSVSISDENSEFVFFATTAQTVGDVQNWLDNPSIDFGWIILGNEAAVGSATRFSSRNDPDDGPALFLEFSTVPEPSTLPMFAIAAVLFFRWRKRK